jgi:heat shock protein HtpX
MAKSKIETDHGLSVRMFMTGLGLVVLYAILMIILIRLGVGLGFVVVLGAVMLFCQYYFSDKIAMFSMHAKVVTPEQEPRLHAIVDRLCLLANMEKPKVGVAEIDIPNAFATGRSPSHAVVCATRGIMARLNDEELEAVLAHELSHVAHRDVAVMTIASGVGMLAGLLSRMAMWGAMLGGGGNSRGGNNNNGGGNIVLLEMATMLISMVVYVIAFLLTMALSRYRELAADRSGAILIGKPSVLASALVHVTGDMGRIPRTDLRKAESMNSFFFAPALSGGSAASLFSTHPSLEKRLDALAKLEKELNG